MVFCLIVLSFMHSHYYLTQLDLSELVIEKELMKRQQTQLFKLIM